MCGYDDGEDHIKFAFLFTIKYIKMKLFIVYYAQVLYFPLSVIFDQGESDNFK